MSENCVCFFSPSRQYLDHFVGHFPDILPTFPFSGLSNALPLATMIVVTLRFLHIIQRTAKGAQWKGVRAKNVKNRQKVSKISSTLFDIFRHFSRRAKNVKKSSKIFSTIFSTIFARHRFSGPFWGPLKNSWRKSFFPGDFGFSKSFLEIAKCSVRSSH